MRIKVLEALAAGKAVVASPLAAAGLEVEDGRELLLAETDAEFAAAISLLLAEPERRAALGRAARAWAENGLGWPRIVAAYEALYAGLEGRRGLDRRRTAALPGSRPHGRRRILLLVPFPPSRRATHGGAKVVAELVDGLARHHDVALLYTQVPGDAPLEEELAAACVLVEVVARPRRSVGLRIVQRLRLAARIVGGPPRWVIVSSSNAFRERLREVVERFDPDIVQLEFVVMCDYLDTLEQRRPGRTKVVLTHHDPRARATAKAFSRSRRPRSCGSRRRSPSRSSRRAPWEPSRPRSSSRGTSSTSRTRTPRGASPRRSSRPSARRCRRRGC
jgi:hypothetical protein